MKNLKDHIYYSELYDRFTIEECQELEKSDGLTSLDHKDKAVAKIKKDFFDKCVAPVAIYFMKGERYCDKEKTIQGWLEKDLALDEKLENAIEPEGVRCIKCSSSKMKCISRDLMNYSKDKDEIVFMFQCEKCSKRRAYWENGKEWEAKPILCPKCSAHLQSEHQRKGNFIETIYTCLDCDYSEAESMDLTRKEEEDMVDVNFEANRKKYCLSSEDGVRYSAEVGHMKAIKDLTDDAKERKSNTKLYDEISKIKKLTIVELQSLLNPALEKADFTSLEFEKPEIQKDVILSFSLQDNKIGREKLVSIQDFQMLVKKTLSYTNWRLMSEGATYKLGFLSGRLRGVEGEEDLKRLAKGNLKNKKIKRRGKVDN
ncbi:MAG: hypothetical protein UR66_C0010G0020 [Candidatus Moranbacteria bacterium GW2011_GWE1_35_17]|nr:MAG: hypothetical protein UR66_C0010G0020 [Candidatus Moranbacteria bacterium GW2011_GWE1_35_17]KKP83684.1 MAG: hypothetical protein UR82_C0019G0012 [Candidatus Moranbacteria bacterium GW2011_GWF1_35_5]